MPKRDPLKHPYVNAAALIGAVLLVVLAWNYREVRDAVIVYRVEQFAPLIDRVAAEQGVSPKLVRAVIAAESSGNPEAVSPKKAYGLMQVTRIAEKDILTRNKDLKQGDLLDPTYNITLGTTYLGYLLKRFDGDLPVALAAYNAGPTKIRRLLNEHADIPGEQVVATYAPKETRAYVVRVREFMESDF